MHAIIRQNMRWDNAKVDLKPTYINEADGVIKFNFFGGESSFQALREYRNFSFGRRVNWVESFEKTNNGVQVILKEDINRVQFELYR